MPEVFAKRFEDSFEYAYARPDFKIFLSSQRITAFTALSITALVYLAVMFFIYKMMNSHFNIAYAVFGIILLFMLFGAGYPLICNALRETKNRRKKSFEGYESFLINVFNAYFEERFFEGNIDFDKSVYSESRPVNKRYDNCYAVNNGACIQIKLNNGILISFFEIHTSKFGGENNLSMQESHFSVFAMAEIKTNESINLCNYKQKVSQFIPNNEFKAIIDEGSAYFNWDDLIKALERCNEMVNITAECDKVYIEIADKGLCVNGIGRKKLFMQTRSAIEKVVLIMNIAYCISEKNIQNNI